MSASVPTLFTETTLDGFPLWVVLLICGGVFLAGFMDAIAGGGGIISVPVYLMAFSGLPTHFVLGTNKLSSCIGTAFSTARFIHQGYVHWRLFLPAAGLAVAGSVCGTQLQLHTPDVVLGILRCPGVADPFLLKMQWEILLSPIETTTSSIALSQELSCSSNVVQQTIDAFGYT